MALDDNGRKELYRKLLNDPATSAGTKKYSFTQWEQKIAESPNALAKIGAYAISKKWANDLEDFSNRYGAGAKPYTPPATPKPKAAPVAAPVAIEEEEAYIPEPPPVVGSPEYEAQLQAQYGGMTPTLGATFGGVPAAFETKAQKKQEQISPVFKAQKLAFEDVPIAEEQRRAQRQFAKATKERQQAALMGGPGFEVEQKKRKKERGYGEWGEDVVGSWVEGGKRIGKNILSTVGYFAQTQAATDPMANLPYEKRQEMMQQASQTMYDNATAAQNTFQNEIAKRNIQTSVLQAINKGDYSRLPESVLYTVGDAAMQIIPSILTFGGSTYAQTLPQVYKDGVDAIAKEKGISPEQAIANGDDAFVVSQINAGVQSALEYAGAGLVSKGIASKGGYKAMRDWLLSQNVNRRLAQGAALLGVGTGEAATEYGQELTGQIGKAAAASSTTKAFLDKLPKELFTPEAKKQRQEAFVGGMVGGLGLAGGGQAIQSAMDRTLFEAPKIGKATQRADYDVVQTDNKITERNKIAQAMEEAVRANPEAAGQIRQQYQKLINEAAPTDEEVLSAYESLSALPETEEKNAIRENLEGYMAERGIQAEPTGMDAGLGELMRREPSVIQTVNAEFPAPVAEEAVTEELTPQEEDEDLAAFGRELEAIEQAAPVAPAEEAPGIAPLNIDFTKNEGRNVNYQGVEGRIKIDSDGAPYVFTKDGDVVYIEGGLSGQTPQQLGVQPLADDVINEADVETVLQDDNAPLDQNQLEYDFDNNTVTLYGKPFTYEGVETNSKGQTTALRLRDANGKVKFVRNEDTILEFEIQKELYEKSRTNKPITVESATAAADQLQVVPVARIEQVPQQVQQERPVGDIESDEVVSAAPVAPAQVFRPELPTIQVPKPEGFAPFLRKLGYTDEEISKMSFEQQQEIATNKTEPARAAGESKVDVAKENQRLERVAEAQKKIDEEIAAEEAALAAPEVVAAAPVEEVAPEVAPETPAAPAPKGRVEVVFPTAFEATEVKPYAEVEDNYYRPDQQLKFNQGTYEPVRIIAHPDVIRAMSIGSKLRDNNKRKTVTEQEIDFANGIAKQLGFTTESGKGSAIMLHNAARELAKQNRSNTEERFVVIGEEQGGKKKAPAPKAETKEEAQQEPKAAQKIAAISPTNLQVFKGVVTKDPLKPKMQGVYFDKANQKIVATDGMNMVVVDRDVKSDVIIDPKTGQVIKETFPDYQTVIPTDYTKVVRNVSINDLLGKLDAIIKGDKERTEKAIASITFDEEQVGITPKVLKAGLKALKDLGYETASIEYKAPNKPLLIKTKDGKTLLLTMPAFLGEDGAEGAISIGEFALEDTKKPKAEVAQVLKKEEYDFSKVFEPLTEEEQKKIDKENLQEEVEEKQRLFDKAGFDKSWAKNYDEAKTKLIDQYNKAKEKKEKAEAKVIKKSGGKSVFVGDEVGGAYVSVDRINEKNRLQDIAIAEKDMAEAVKDLAKLGVKLPSQIKEESVTAAPIAETKEGKKAEAKEEKVTPTDEAKEGFTEGPALNKIYADVKAKYGDKKGASIMEVALRLVNPNQNAIIEVRSNGVVVKEGGKYLFKPFSDTDLNQNKWRLGKPLDISEQFAQPEAAPSFTSQQSSEAATAFDKAKTSKGFDKKYGKGAYKALSDITKNFEDIMDKVSDKIKQDCII